MIIVSRETLEYEKITFVDEKRSAKRYYRFGPGRWNVPKGDALRRVGNDEAKRLEEKRESYLRRLGEVE